MTGLKLGIRGSLIRIGISRMFFRALPWALMLSAEQGRFAFFRFRFNAVVHEII